MSIRERIEAIRAGEFEGERLEGECYRRRKEERKALEKRYSQELPEAIVQRARLLEALREMGVIGMVEELTGPIEPLKDFEGNYIVRRPTKEELEERARLALSPAEDGRLYPEYEAEILFPEMGEDGSASQDLRVGILHHYQVGIPNMSGGSGWVHGIITLRYRQDGQLTIFGERVTFSGKVSKENPQLDEVKEALAQALVHPITR